MRRWLLERRVLRAALSFGLAVLGHDAAAQLAPIAIGQASTTQPRSLRLEVLINGRSTGLIEPFEWRPPSRLFVRRSVLGEVGVKTPGRGGPRDLVDLADLVAVTYRFDDPAQRIDFHLADGQRLAHVYDARDRIASAPAARSDWGALMNYSLYGTTVRQRGAYPRFSGLNATLDARAFSPVGSLEQTMIVGDTVASGRPALRLDTTYTYSDPAWIATARIGDTISGALVWTRPIRYAGLQVQRDFGLRPDLVTLPLPSVSGSAVVPSTVDVFVNNVKAYTQDVGEGPYSLVNLPIPTGGGHANVVVTDASGRQTDSTLPLFAAATVLAPDLLDFSVDAGFARYGYGTLSDAYDPRPVVSAIARYGLDDWMTVEAHAEGGAGLLNGGAGAVTRLWSWGALSTAASLSRYGQAQGAQLFGGYDLQIGPYSLDLAAQRSLGHFDDLGSIGLSSRLGALADRIAPGLFSLDARPPRALDRVSLGLPLWFDASTLSLSLIRAVEADGQRSRIATAAWTRPLPHDATLFAAVFVDFGTVRGAGVFGGLSVPLGDHVQASIGAGTIGGATAVDVVKPLDHTDGAIGWRVNGGSGSSLQRVEGAYRSAYATGDLGITELKGTLGAQAEVDGSFGFIAGGGAFAGNRIDDGFALVDAGAPHVPVMRDNRPVGETDAFGHYVVTDMAAYQNNQIAIDPERLPVSAEARTTRQVVAPAARSGVVLDFGVDTHVAGALVTFQDRTGRPIPPGSKGTVAGQADPFVVGYDGQAYLKHLAATNAVTIDLGEVDCHAVVAYQASESRAAVGPVACR